MNSVAIHAYSSGVAGRFDCEDKAPKTKHQCWRWRGDRSNTKTAHARSMRLSGHKWLGRLIDAAWGSSGIHTNTEGAAMNRLKKTLQILLAAIAALQLSACAKNVQWQEEVLLNTGETIWIFKEARYTIKGQPGNPLDMGYLPDFEEITSFKYGGRDYTYKGDAGVMVLAISPQKLPVLLASPGSNDWYRHHSYPLCAKPYYVQFVPGSTGQTWTWPSQIEPWTYNLPANLMLNRDHPSNAKRRYTMADKAQQGYMQDPRSLYLQKIDPLNTNQNCHKE